MNKYVVPFARSSIVDGVTLGAGYSTFLCNCAIFDHGTVAAEMIILAHVIPCARVSSLRKRAALISIWTKVAMFFLHFPWQLIAKAATMQMIFIDHSVWSNKYLDCCTIVPHNWKFRI